jgi:hypothetical protein
MGQVFMVDGLLRQRKRTRRCHLVCLLDYLGCRRPKRPTTLCMSVSCISNREMLGVVECRG